MQILHAGYKGLSLIFVLNWDRLIYVATLIVALLLGSWVGNVIF